MPGREFYLSQSIADQAKLTALFKRIADRGFIDNREKFKKLGEKSKRDGKDLWEFKSFQLRMLGEFRAGREFVVAIGVVKKRDDLNPGDVERAVRVLKEDRARTRKRE